MTVKMEGFSGKVAIVTGSSEGIGYSIAKALIVNGAKVLLVARRESVLAAAAETLGPNASWLSIDITQPYAPQQIVEKAAADHGGIDILVNSAGVNLLGSLESTSLAEMQQMTALNLFAPWLMTQAALPYLVARQGAAVLNVSSAGSRKATLSEGFYAATKAALNYLTKVWALELADRGIRVNAIAPGGSDTPQFNRAASSIPGAREMVMNAHLIKRLANPDEDLTGAALLLLSSVAGSFMTGSLIEVDGGYHIT